MQMDWIPIPIDKMEHFFANRRKSNLLLLLLLFILLLQILYKQY